MAPPIGFIPWNKGKKTGITPWLGKKRPDLKNTKASKTMFKKGSKPWNTGKKMSLETIEKLRMAKIGHIPWNKGLKIEYKPRFSMRGKPAWNSGVTAKEDDRILAKEKNPNWQGGITESNWSLRYKTEYKYWRRRILSRDNYKCTQCGSSERIQVDHIKPFSIHKELRLDDNNGRVLCFRCHINTPTWGGRAVQRSKEVVPGGAFR